MDRSLGTGRRRAPAPWPQGRPAPGRRGSPSPPSGGNATAPRPETPRHPGGKRHGTPGETRGTPRAETPRPPAGNGRHPGVKRRNVAGVNAVDHRPPGGNAAGQRPSGRNAPLAGQPSAERMPGGGAGRARPSCPSFRGGRGRQWTGRTSRTAAHLAGRPDRLANPFPDHKFRDRKYLLAASETTIIHSLTCQLLERDQLLPLNGRHIRSPPQPWPPRPPGSTARADGNRLYCISAGHETGDMKCPRSGSNRHWGPF
jgi:hypothetical protein